MGLLSTVLDHGEAHCNSLCGGAPCRETDAGLVNVGTVWNVYDKLLQGLMASWRSYLQLPNLKFRVVQVCYIGTTQQYCIPIEYLCFLPFASACFSLQ